jgi:hypothetical protein
MFRDENAKVGRKARGSGKSLEQGMLPGKGTSPSKSPQSSSAITPSHIQAYQSPSPPAIAWDSEILSIVSVVYPLGLDLSAPEHKGVAFFFTHYASINGPFADRSLDPKMSPLYVDLHRSKPFLDAVSSVGLAGLSNVTKDRSLMLAAKHKHMETLSHVAGVLSNINSADLEETLKQVMLLNIFEVGRSVSLDFALLISACSW